MSSTETFRSQSEFNAEPTRDRCGRPMIKQPNGPDIAYTRMTTVSGLTDDKSNLEKWSMRLVLKGAALRKALVARAATLDLENGKDELNKLAEQAKEAAGGSDAAALGTALHKAAEIHDLGKPLPTLPSEMAKDLAAYVELTTIMRHVHIESFMVNDLARVAGTPDRLSVTPWSDDLVVVDIKTGKDMKYGQGSMAAQLTGYSRMNLYNPLTGERTKVRIEQSFGIVVHVPVGQAHATLYRVDMDRGLEVLKASSEVYRVRKFKDLLTPLSL
jgi:hypothetical protein